uniref:Uncharacterized protein n=1 Tax=Glossina austeni TaxID=7395 RepID=A0A1A9VP33_GLOAU
MSRSFSSNLAASATAMWKMVEDTFLPLMIAPSYKIMVTISISGLIITSLTSPAANICLGAAVHKHKCCNATGLNLEQMLQPKSQTTSKISIDAFRVLENLMDLIAASLETQN